jgi:uncharacterized protein (DUF305 family)
VVVGLLAIARGGGTGGTLAGSTHAGSTHAGSTHAGSTHAGDTNAGSDHVGGTDAGKPVGTVAFNASDVAWLQMMIPMDDRMLRLLDLVPARGGDARVRALAARVAAAQRSEVGRLRALLDQSGMPETDVHAAHDLPGMVPLAELARAGTLRGMAFDAIVVRGLRDHCRQAVLVASGERANGSRLDVLAIAEAVTETRRAYLAALGLEDQSLPGS